MVVKDEPNHGGKVSYVLANNGSQTFNINMVEVASEEFTTFFFGSQIAAGIGESVRDGARVVNASFSGNTLGVPFSTCTDCNENVSETNAYSNYLELVNGNGGLGAILVRAAGNEGRAINQPTYFDSKCQLPRPEGRSL